MVRGWQHGRLTVRRQQWIWHTVPEHVWERAIKNKGEHKGTFGLVNPPPTHPSLCIFLASYCVTSAIASPGSAPRSAPDHITALSHAGSPAHISVIPLLFFPFLDHYVSVSSDHRVTCQVHPFSSLMWCALLPDHCHQQAGSLDMHALNNAWKLGKRKMSWIFLFD